MPATKGYRVTYTVHMVGREPTRHTTPIYDTWEAARVHRNNIRGYGFIHNVTIEEVVEESSDDLPSA